MSVLLPLAALVLSLRGRGRPHITPPAMLWPPRPTQASLLLSTNPDRNQVLGFS